MQMLLIFVLGVGVLVGALALNAVASAFGLLSWYDFLKNPGAADVLSYLWLFVLYPLGLGLVAFVVGTYLFK